MYSMILTLLLGATPAPAAFAPLCELLPSVPCSGFSSYCVDHGDYKSGWFIHSSGEAVVYNSLAGAPDPYTIYKVRENHSDGIFGSFNIHRYQKSDGALLNVIGPFLPVSSSAILFDGELLETRNCEGTIFPFGTR